MVGDVQMRHRIESQGLLEQLSIELQELARVCRASIRDDKADIEILRMLGELGDEALLREVHHNHAMLNFKIVSDTASYLNQCGFPPGHQHYVDSRGRDLPRELSPCTTLIPAAATCLANSLPMPDEAPVTSAHGPNCRLSSAAFIVLLPSDEFMD